MLLVLFLLLLFPLNAAAFGEEAKLQDPEQEAQAREIFGQLRCAACAGQALADSEAGLARDMRAFIRGQIAAGKTREEILAFIRSRYGDRMLLEPPFDASTYALWAGPFAALLLGLALVVFHVKRNR